MGRRRRWDQRTSGNVEWWRWWDNLRVSQPEEEEEQEGKRQKKESSLVVVAVSQQHTDPAVDEHRETGKNPGLDGQWHNPCDD